MKICDLPISFFNDDGQVQILLAAVGMKVPRVFSLLSGYIQKIINDLDLDSSSWLPESLGLKGTVKFSLSTCESPDALPFLLGLGDEQLPHNDFHVIVGAALAESQDDLVNFSKNFVQTVNSLSPRSVPCLYVFSTASFEQTDLPNCATQLPIDSTDAELYRRVREGFVMFLMNFILSQQQNVERLITQTDNASSMLKLASCIWIFRGRDRAIEYFEKALKLKNPRVTAVTLEAGMNPNFGLSFDKYTSNCDLPIAIQDLDNEPEFTNQVRTAISSAAECKDRLVLARILLRMAIRIPKFARRFICEALHLCMLGKRAQYNLYAWLGLILLYHFGYTRTFLYQTNTFIEKKKNIPVFVTKFFVQALTSGSDWLEQRLGPASNIFATPAIPREIKNNIVQYLLTYLHVIRIPNKQSELLEMVPTGTKIDASILLNIEGIKYLIPSQPIEPATKSIRSSVFIFSPLEKRKLQNIAAVGDLLSFIVTITNPLHIELPLELITLTATSGSSTPFSCTIEAEGTVQIPLVISPTSAGEMKITGFQFSIRSIQATYVLPQPIVFTVINELPTLNVCLPFRRFDTFCENSNNQMTFELVNGGDVELDLKPIKFAPAPPVLVSTSLPIYYPPKLEPELPEKLLPGTTHRFQLELTSDVTFTDLSFAIEYGTKDYIRRFEYNMPLVVEKGPRISRVEVIPLDEHDDFEDNQATLLIVIENPTDEPITVSSDDVKQTFVKRHSFGTFLVNINRAEMPEDIGTKWSVHGLTAEHIRKCETSEIKAQQRELTPEERRRIWTALFIKLRIKQQLSLVWKNQHAQGGPLPFTHIELDDKALTLLQPPPFNVDFSIKRIEDEVWEIECNVTSTNEHKFKAMLAFDVANGQVMIAGKSVYSLVSPAKFTAAVHCDLQEKLSLTAKFFIGEAFFVRKAEFDLITPIV